MPPITVQKPLVIKLLLFLMVLTMALGLWLVQNLPLPHIGYAAGVVGSGTPASCTEAAFDSVLSGGGAISFSCGAAPVTITFNSEKPVAADTTIDGGNLITLKGGSNNRLLHIAYQKSLSVRNLTFQDTNLTSASEDGGVVIKGEWQSNLSVSNARFINNIFTNTGGSTYDKGGAIFMPGGVVTVDNSQFTGNISYNSGGSAIHTVGANLTVTNSTFSGNRATETGNGGAIYSDNVKDNDGFVVIQGSTFNGNTSQSEGGAIRTNLYNGNQSATYDRNIFANNSVTFDPGGRAIGGAVRVGDGRFSFTNSVFSGNAAQGQGGAIWTGETVQLTIANTAIINNRATDPAGTMGFGGGLAVNSSASSNINIVNTTFSDNTTGFMGGAMSFNTTGPVNITNSTIANNYAWWQGGGIQNGRENVVLRNTIVANNTANNGGNNWNIYHNCFPNGGSYTNGGNNLQYTTLSASSDECGTAIPNSLDPRLGPLANNGGFSSTRALLPGSPAIDTANNTTCPATDQRGVTRPGTGPVLTAVCDIGAFEVTNQTPPATPPVIPPGTPPPPGGGNATPRPSVNPAPELPTADLVAQFRQMPDRVVALNPENPITYTLSVKNIGVGQATNLVLTLPLDPSLVVGYARFANAQTWVTTVTTTSLTISLPPLKNKEVITGTLVLRPRANPSPTPGSQVVSRYSLRYDDPAGAGKRQQSNAVAFVFGLPGTNSNVSGGAIQLFKPATLTAPVGTRLKLSGDYYMPGEVVTAWLTKTDNSSIPLGNFPTNAEGLLNLNIETRQLVPGTYTVAGRGNRSEITLSSQLTLTAASPATVSPSATSSQTTSDKAKPTGTPTVRATPTTPSPANSGGSTTGAGLTTISPANPGLTGPPDPKTGR